MRTGSRKFIASRKRTAELYDIESDPGETRNLCDDDPAACNRLRGVLKRRNARMAEIARRLMLPPPEPAEVGDETRERLKILGYTE